MPSLRMEPSGMIRMVTITATTLLLQPNQMLVRMCLERHTWMSLDVPMRMGMDTQMQETNSMMTHTNGLTTMEMVTLPTQTILATRTLTVQLTTLMRIQHNGLTQMAMGMEITTPTRLGQTSGHRNGPANCWL